MPATALRRDPINLRDLAFDSADEQDLRWRWTWAEGEMGLHSNYQAMAAQLELGGPTCGRPIMEFDDHCIRAAGRARRIDRALEAIGEDRARVLRAAFGPDAPTIRQLGIAAGTAPLTRSAITAWRRSRSDRDFGPWLLRLCWRVEQHTGDQLEMDRATLAAIRRECEALLHAAMRAFSAARRTRR